jgi:hypothetical protein
MKISMDKIYQKTELPITSLNEVQLPEKLPPIMIVCFNRPDLLEQVLPAIEKQILLPPKIIAFVDGPRNEKDIISVQQCVKLLTEFSQKIEVEIITRTQNLGCSLNVINAFSETLSKYPSLVYLEDDTVPNIYFYDRICRLLEVYKDIKKVFSVNSYETSPGDVSKIIKEDFMVSNRFFPWGFGTWSDRWYSLDIEQMKQNYNPFDKFYHIPLTQQTKLTTVNQYFLEKTGKNDWSVTLNLASFYQDYVHVTPMISFIRNVGFGHAESFTYKGGEPEWVNCNYDDSFNPDKLPLNVEPIEKVKKPLTDLEVIEFFKKKNLYLNLDDARHLFLKYKSWQFRFLLLKLVISQQIKRRSNKKNFKK